MSAWDAFLAFQAGLPRQGPGDRESLDAALRVLNLPSNARICDAGCGVGADVEGLLAHAPEGTVLAVDTDPGFIEVARDRFPGDPRVSARVMDMVEIPGPLDLIWCAGALYFIGLEGGLAAFRKVLTPTGAVALSYPVYFTDSPSDTARAMWQGEATEVPGIEEALAKIKAAGFEVLYAQPLSDAAWEAYYGPMEASIAERRATADEDLTAVLRDSETEIATWRAAKSETGYLHVVAQLS